MQGFYVIDKRGQELWISAQHIISVDFNSLVLLPGSIPKSPEWETGVCITTTALLPSDACDGCSGSESAYVELIREHAEAFKKTFKAKANNIALANGEGDGESNDG